jgi:NADP-dependent 3-hydroxy acid dehydrogenase YdfG
MKANKVAAVTGGSAGIGKVVCEQLLNQGYEVVSLARRRAGIEHPRLHSIEVDLADRAATAEAVQAMVRRHEVTTIVHNAGVIRAALLPARAAQPGKGNDARYLPQPAPE